MAMKMMEEEEALKAGQARSPGRSPMPGLPMSPTKPLTAADRFHAPAKPDAITGRPLTEKEKKRLATYTTYNDLASVKSNATQKKIHKLREEAMAYGSPPLRARLEETPSPHPLLCTSSRRPKLLKTVAP